MPVANLDGFMPIMAAAVSDLHPAAFMPVIEKSVPGLDTGDFDPVRVTAFVPSEIQLIQVCLHLRSGELLRHKNRQRASRYTGLRTVAGTPPVQERGRSRNPA